MNEPYALVDASDEARFRNAHFRQRP